MNIDTEYGDFHLFACGHDVGRITDKTVRELADMYQAVLMDADINEGAELGDVGDDARQLHALVKILDVVHILRQRKTR